MASAARDSCVINHNIYALKFCSIYKFLCKRTVSSTWTASSGCRPTLWCLVFCSPSGLFHRDPKLTSFTRTWYRQDNFIVTQNLASTYRDCQKTRYPDTDANSLNRRAVMLKRQRLTRQLLPGQHAPKHNSEE